MLYDAGGGVGLPDVRSVESRTGTTRECPVDRFVPADLRHSRESNENELANYPEPPARVASILDTTERPRSGLEVART